MIKLLFKDVIMLSFFGNLCDYLFLDNVFLLCGVCIIKMFEN